MKWAVFKAAIMAGVPVALGQTITVPSSGASTGSITTAPSTLSSTSSSVPSTQTVSVGQNHDFRPDSITADPGDVIVFKFWPTNHSVVRAAYENPCVPYNYIYSGQPTFFSGNMLSNVGDTQPTWSLTVNDTEPTFFYCAAPGSCQTYAMVGVINPNATMTLDVQKAYQKNVTFQLSPGEPWPAEASSTLSNLPGATATASSSANNSGSSGSSHSTLGAGAIAGIAIGGAAVLIAGIVLVWFCGRKGGIETGFRKSSAIHPSAPMVEANYAHAPQSPPPQSFRDSPYGAHSETFRAGSPAAYSQATSPHNSYMGAFPSPGLQSSFHDAHQGANYTEALKPQTEAPVELPGSTHHPNSPGQRHEFPG